MRLACTLASHIHDSTRTFLVLDLRLDVVNSVAGLDLKRDSLASQRLDEDLHATTQAQHEMKGGLFLDVVVRKRTAILELLAREDQALLIRRDAYKPTEPSDSPLQVRIEAKQVIRCVWHVH
jgi:hypothetical protein